MVVICFFCFDGDGLYLSVSVRSSDLTSIRRTCRIIQLNQCNRRNPVHHPSHASVKRHPMIDHSRHPPLPRVLGGMIERRFGWEI